MTHHDDDCDESDNDGDDDDYKDDDGDDDDDDDNDGGDDDDEPCPPSEPSQGQLSFHEPSFVSSPENDQDHDYQDYHQCMMMKVMMMIMSTKPFTCL